VHLPEDDEAYLNGKRFTWELLPGGPGAYLVIRDFAVSGDKYDRDLTDLMIMIPAGYNQAQLDMYWVDPRLLLKNGQYPPAANVFETHLNRSWQRFSRHLSQWRPGLDGLPMFFALIQSELQERRG
jgi:hypothetical protein